MTERVFTDFNLAELKRDLNNESNPDPTLWEPLIHRLECAEEFIKQHRCADSECEDTQAWRKSAGRE